VWQVGSGVGLHGAESSKVLQKHQFTKRTQVKRMIGALREALYKCIHI